MTGRVVEMPSIVDADEVAAVTIAAVHPTVGTAAVVE